MATYYGFNPPFIGGPQNVLSRQEDEQLIKNDILQLLLTNPGDRVNRPRYGVPLRSFVFEQNTPGDLAVLRSDIVEAVNEFEPRVVVDSCDVAQARDDYTIFIKLIVRMRDDPRRLLTIERLINLSVNSEV